MVLPQAVSKATGLHGAARALRLSLHNALAIGDAENDHDLLGACEIGVAVSWGSAALQRSLAALEIDEAALLPGAEESGRELVRFRIGRRLTPHVRHKHKYLERPVAEPTGFAFLRNGRPTGRGDFSRWIADVFADDAMQRCAASKMRWRAGQVDRPYDSIARAIRRRYVEQAPCAAAPGD